MEKTLTAREIVKKGMPGDYENKKLVKYGKINKNLAFEWLKDKGPYLSEVNQSVVFVLYDEALDTAKLILELSFSGTEDEVINHINEVVNKYKK